MTGATGPGFTGATGPAAIFGVSNCYVKKSFGQVATTNTDIEWDFSQIEGTDITFDGTSTFTLQDDASYWITCNLSGQNSLNSDSFLRFAFTDSANTEIPTAIRVEVMNINFSGSSSYGPGGSWVYYIAPAAGAKTLKLRGRDALGGAMTLQTDTCNMTIVKL